MIDETSADFICCNPADPDFRDCHECGHDFDTPCCCVNDLPALDEAWADDDERWLDIDPFWED